jgi:hypothetical protein
MLVQAVPRQSGRKLILSDAGVQAAVTDIDVDFTPPSDKDENESDAASEEAGENEAEKKQPGDTGSQKKKGRSSRKAKHNPQMENVQLGPMGDHLWSRPSRCSSIKSGTSSLFTKVKFSIVSVI